MTRYRSPVVIGKEAVMSALTLEERGVRTLAEVVEGLGSIPLERIPAMPCPGAATEQDLLRPPGGEDRLYELADGVLVEKPMGYYESVVAAVLIRLLGEFVEQHRLGIIMTPDAPLRLAPGLVRLPDVSFVSWRHFPDRELPAEQILDRAPDLAVEILSPGNTEAEMQRKLREYFAAGTSLAWLVDPRTRTARVYTSPADCAEVPEDGELDGGSVLPGFRLSLRDWFERAGRRR
jgi:Uma2 family endonuclease